MKTDSLKTPNGTVTLHRARPDDCAAVTKIQHAAYRKNRRLLGVEPLPLQADYPAIFKTCEVWLKSAEIAVTGIDAVLILETGRPKDVLIWSIAIQPSRQQQGIGKALLACAEQRARELGRDSIRLYTGEKLTHLINWYDRSGYEVERVEELEDRNIVHMYKLLT